MTRRFRKAGLRRAAEARRAGAILDRLAPATSSCFPFDQHASRKDGVLVEFFGHPAGTFRSLAVIALTTGAPVVPASSWREADGRHVLRFEEPLAPIEHADTNEAIRLQHARLQPRAGAHDPAPSGAVVVGAPPLEAWAAASGRRLNCPERPRVDR